MRKVKAMDIGILKKFPEYMKLKTQKEVTKQYDFVYDMMMKTCGTSKHNEWVQRERALYRMSYHLSKGGFHD
jgi:hypothetical protein